MLGKGDLCHSHWPEKFFQQYFTRMGRNTMLYKHGAFSWRHPKYTERHCTVNGGAGVEFRPLAIRGNAIGRAATGVAVFAPGDSLMTVERGRMPGVGKLVDIKGIVGAASQERPRGLRSRPDCRHPQEFHRALNHGTVRLVLSNNYFMQLVIEYDLWRFTRFCIIICERTPIQVIVFCRQQKRI